MKIGRVHLILIEHGAGKTGPLFKFSTAALKIQQIKYKMKAYSFKHN
jgi:hypothetical protein